MKFCIVLLACLFMAGNARSHDDPEVSYIVDDATSLAIDATEGLHDCVQSLEESKKNAQRATELQKKGDFKGAHKLIKKSLEEAVAETNPIGIYRDTATNMSTMAVEATALHMQKHKSNSSHKASDHPKWNRHIKAIHGITGVLRQIEALSKWIETTNKATLKKVLEQNSK